MNLAQWLPLLAIESLAIQIYCNESEFVQVGLERMGCPLLSAQWKSDVPTFTRRLLHAFPETLRRLTVGWQSCRPSAVPTVIAFNRDQTPSEYYPVVRRLMPYNTQLWGEWSRSFGTAGFI